ncbi:MAG: hypothetical protein ACJAS3_000987 [Roseivirga sp.]|jgi:hypothetical protein
MLGQVHTVAISPPTIHSSDTLLALTDGVEKIPIIKIGTIKDAFNIFS